MRRFRLAFILVAGLLATGSLSGCCGPFYGGCGGHGWHDGGGHGGGYGGGGGGGGWMHGGGEGGGGHPN